MKKSLSYKAAKVALLLGSAISLFACAKKSVLQEPNPDTLMTQQSDTLTLVNSQNGVLQYRFYTPLMERYELAREPYMEFRYGVDVITYDSIGNVSSTLVADYAIYYENRKLWEARGNVAVMGEGGKHLYTQQLFWDQQTDKIYSNVDSKVVQDDDVFVGDGFESDSKFERWEFRNTEGRIMVDVAQHERQDSLATDSLQDNGSELNERERPASSKQINEDARRNRIRRRLSSNNN